MDGKLRVGMVGLGFISVVHMDGYKRCPEVELVAFCDIIEERAKAACLKYGTPDAKTYTSYLEMLKTEKLDAISVCTENNMHSAIAVAALDAGVHVFCEKPMTISSVEADAMVAAAKRNGKKLSVGYQLRFTENAQMLHDMVVNGDLGKIYYAEAKAMRRRGVPTWGVFLNMGKQGGGPLIDIGTHLVDFTLWLMNDYSPVVSAVGNLNSDLIPLGGYNDGGPWDIGKFEVEDGAFGMVTLQSGATLLVNATWAVNMKEPGRDGAILYGVKGGAELMQGLLTLNGEHHGRLWESTPRPVRDSSALSPYDKEIAWWVDCLVHDTEPKVKPEEAAQVVKVLEAIYRSARNGGKAVTL
jgi:predicted dehydrogenase